MQDRRRRARLAGAAAGVVVELRGERVERGATKWARPSGWWQAPRPGSSAVQRSRSANALRGDLPSAIAVQRAGDRRRAVDARSALPGGLGREVDRDAGRLGDRARRAPAGRRRRRSRGRRRELASAAFDSSISWARSGGQPGAEVAADEDPGERAAQSAGGGEQRRQRRAGLELVDTGGGDRADHRDERRAGLGARADRPVPAGPWRAISAMCASVSTFWISVGRRRTPRSVGRGGMNVGRGGPPLSCETSAVSWPVRKRRRRLKSSKRDAVDARRLALAQRVLEAQPGAFVGRLGGEDRSRRRRPRARRARRRRGRGGAASRSSSRVLGAQRLALAAVGDDDRPAARATARPRACARSGSRRRRARAGRPRRVRRSAPSDRPGAGRAADRAPRRGGREAAIARPMQPLSSRGSATSVPVAAAIAGSPGRCRWRRRSRRRSGGRRPSASVRPSAEATRALMSVPSSAVIAPL